MKFLRPFLHRKKITTYLNQGVQICGYVYRNTVGYFYYYFISLLKCIYLFLHLFVYLFIYLFIFKLIAAQMFEKIIKHSVVWL